MKASIFTIFFFIPLMSIAQLQHSKLPTDIKKLDLKTELSQLQVDQLNLAGEYMISSYKRKRASFWFSLLTTIGIIYLEQGTFKNIAVFSGGFMTGWCWWSGEKYISKAGKILYNIEY